MKLPFTGSTYWFSLCLVSWHSSLSHGWLSFLCI